MHLIVCLTLANRSSERPKVAIDNCLQRVSVSAAEYNVFLIRLSID